MTKDAFLKALQAHAATFERAVSTKNGDWIVKGFIDVYRNIYTISVDTKVVSKIMELLLFPELVKFAEEHRLKMVLTEHQNHYPDISFMDEEGHLFAVDLKSSYRENAEIVNGMTLGAFTGYFRERKSTKNTRFPYGKYEGHYVLGVIYSKTEHVADERKPHPLAQLEKLASVVRDFKFFVQEKYRIASDRPGSGNTKNIGSVQSIEALVNGKGPFASLGEKAFDDYWSRYLTKDMALAAELAKPPYKNLSTYLAYKKVPR